MNNGERYYDALKRIASYMTPDKLRKCAEGEYGLPFHEALEYAYENILDEARRATYGRRRPKSPRAVTRAVTALSPAESAGVPGRGNG